TACATREGAAHEVPRCRLSPRGRSGSGRRCGSCWPGCASSRQQTAPEVTPCASSSGAAIISVEALLRLAEWSRQRRRPLAGGQSCDALTTPLPPPAPQRSETDPAASVASVPGADSSEDAQTSQPDCRSC